MLMYTKGFSNVRYSMILASSWRQHSYQELLAAGLKFSFKQTRRYTQSTHRDPIMLPKGRVLTRRDSSSWIIQNLNSTTQIRVNVLNLFRNSFIITNAWRQLVYHGTDSAKALFSSCNLGKHRLVSNIDTDPLALKLKLCAPLRHFCMGGSGK